MWLAIGQPGPDLGHDGDATLTFQVFGVHRAVLAVLKVIVAWLNLKAKQANVAAGNTGIGE